MKRYWCHTLAGIVALGTAAPADAGQLSLTIGQGRVTLHAEAVTLPQILDAWTRVGGSEIVNAGSLPGDPVTLRLESVSETAALDVILGPASGYIALPRRADAPGLSLYGRILVLPRRAAVPPEPQDTAAADSVEPAAAGPEVDDDMESKP